MKKDYKQLWCSLKNIVMFSDRRQWKTSELYKLMEDMELLWAADKVSGELLKKES